MDSQNFLFIKLREKVLSRKFFLFVANGGVSYSLKAGLTWLFSERIILSFALSYGITLIVVVLYNYFFNVFVTFRVKGGLAERFIRYLVFVGIFNLCDYFMVLALNSFVPWSYQITIFLVTGFLMVIKFFAFDRWVFNEKRIITE